MKLKITKKDEPIGLDMDQEGNIEFRELIYEIHIEEDSQE